jgi:uncharacterized protein
MQVVGVAFGFVIGLALGMLGGGGSILTVPIFVYILGYGAKESIAMSLAVVGATSLVGAFGHWREGRVRLRVALTFGAVATAGTYVGARFAMRLTGEQQLMIFAAAMLAAAAVMIRGVRIEAGSMRSRIPVALVAVRGLLVGAVTGLAGIGGGFLIVPALVSGGLTMGDAVGTSLVVIALNCLMGLYGRIGSVAIDWRPVLLVTAGALPGIATGTYAMQWLSQQTLRRGFAALLLAVAAFMLYGNLTS